MHTRNTTLQASGITILLVLLYILIGNTHSLRRIRRRIFMLMLIFAIVHRAISHVIGVRVLLHVLLSTCLSTLTRRYALTVFWEI